MAHGGRCQAEKMSLMREQRGEWAMRAMMIEEPGGPEVLQLREVRRPEPGEGEALVRLHAAGVNFVDVGQRRSGRNIPGGLPAILGREGAGEVVALGPGAAGH